MEQLAKPRAQARAGRGWYEVLARTGLVAKGVSYGLVGVLAIGVAVGVGGKATSQTGALKQLAGSSFGSVVLVLLAAGLAAYALWRFAQAATTRRRREEGVGQARAVRRPRPDLRRSRVQRREDPRRRRRGLAEPQGAQNRPGVVLSWPGGTWIVGIAGATIIGVGLWNAYRGVLRGHAGIIISDSANIEITGNTFQGNLALDQPGTRAVLMYDGPRNPRPMHDISIHDNVLNRGSRPTPPPLEPTTTRPATTGDVSNERSRSLSGRRWPRRGSPPNETKDVAPLLPPARLRALASVVALVIACPWALGLARAVELSSSIVCGLM